ncbi:MAG: hypothetical protein JNK85_11390 [Verrucomicrobiales bacterium]|nr:hypothetical protein [Verrucomicrobiales bacterium]
MLRLLLDKHIAKAVALQAKGKRPSMDIQSIHDWEAGTFLGVPDAEILMVAAKQRLTLMTYDQRTLWKHASDLLESGHELGGVVFVDEQSIPPNDIGGLMRALVWLWETRGTEDWHNRLIYLCPGPAAPNREGDRRSTEGKRRKRSAS